MNEAQMIGLFQNCFPNIKAFQVILLEEIFVCDPLTGDVIFYCALYERVKTEIIDIFPDEIKSEKHYRTVISEFAMYLYQGLNMLREL